MQPRTSVRFDNAAFERLKSRVQDIAQSQRHLLDNPAYATKVPRQIGLKLNNGCNLRCVHCYEWNNQGYHQTMNQIERKNEMPLSVVEALLAATREERARLYLWGGEPLMYSRFDDLMRLLEQDRRWTTLCTNAMLTEKKLDSLLRASECLAFLASVDGLERENDAVRGKGTFERVISALDLLLDLKRKGIYKGTISLSLTLNDHVIGNLFTFVKYFEAMGVDSIYIVFPWYVPPYVAADMDRFVAEKLPELASDIAHRSAASWHSFTYHITPEKIPLLMEDMAKVRSHEWRVRVRFHPALRPEEVEDFILGRPIPAEGKKRCLAITNRMDVLPNGDVVTCKFFPELKAGNLGEQSPDVVWRNGAFTRFRQTLALGLSPVCSKCTLLYTTG